MYGPKNRSFEEIAEQILPNLGMSIRGMTLARLMCAFHEAIASHVVPEKVSDRQEFERSMDEMWGQFKAYLIDRVMQ